MICRDAEGGGQRTDEVAPVAIRRLLESWTPSAGSGPRLGNKEQNKKHRKYVEVETETETEIETETETEANEERKEEEEDRTPSVMTGPHRRRDKDHAKWIRWDGCSAMIQR